MICYYRDLSDNTIFFVDNHGGAHRYRGWGQLKASSTDMNRVLICEDYIETKCRELTLEEVKTECPTLLNYVGVK